MEKNSIGARDVQYVLHPLTNLSEHIRLGPLVIAGGKGIFAFDDAGKDYIEGFAAAGCLALGYGEESLIEAADRQMRELAYSPGIASRTTRPVVELAEKIKSLVGIEASKIFFTCSGSEANDTQIKLQWAYNNALGRPKKKKILSHRLSYHGATIAAGSLTGIPAYHLGFDMPIPQVLHADTPDFGRAAEPGESETEFVSRITAHLEDRIIREGPDTIAAMIVEPVMQAAGVVLPPKGYMEGLAAILQRHDIKLIVDEVICGFGRTGALFGTETYSIATDTMSLGKQLSAGYAPIAAVTVEQCTYDALLELNDKAGGIFGHGFTYGGHPVSAAIALRALEIYEERGIYEHVREIAPYFIRKLTELAERHPLLGQVRGVGLIASVDIVRDKEQALRFDPGQRVGPVCMSKCEGHGLLMRVSNDRALFCPPLIISESEIDEMFLRFERGMGDLLQWARQQEAA